MVLSHRISIYIVNKLIDSKHIDYADKDSYIYCFDYIGEQIFFFICIMLLSLIFHSVEFGILFYITIIPLRSTCGGFHASTRFGCTILSLIFFTGLFFISRILTPIEMIPWIPVFLLCLIILSLNLSIASKKSFDDSDRDKLLKRRRLLLAVYIIIYFVLFFIFPVNYYKIETICIVAATINYLLGQLIERGNK